MGAGSNASGGGSTAGSGGGPEGDEEMPEPTEAEMEEARRVLKDFIDGMGAGGDTSRPGDMGLPEGLLTWEEAVEVMGMSGWRLADKICPEIEELVSQVEDIWNRVLPADNFGVLHLDPKFQYLDSVDPEGTDPFAFLTYQDPVKGDEGYPRLQIENRAYWSRAFRKMHIEVAVRQDGLQVFHCVMYPRLNYDIPILSMDLVANGGRVSLAIVDPCPVSADLSLPAFYEAPIRELQERYQMGSNREIPAWGQAIFSPLCVIVRPSSAEELGRFLKYTLALTQLHVEIAKIAHPISSAQRRRLAAMHAAHQRYCEKQLENDKTRRVLEAAFGAELSGRYMRELMFDCEPLPEGV